MGFARTLLTARGIDRIEAGTAASPGRLVGREDCLEQLLAAFHDLADRDDIHQAASRLTLIQEWIRGEAERAARDPIFADLSLLS